MRCTQSRQLLHLQRFVIARLQAPPPSLPPPISLAWRSFLAQHFPWKHKSQITLAAAIRLPCCLVRCQLSSTAVFSRGQTSPGQPRPVQTRPHCPPGLWSLLPRAAAAAAPCVLVFLEFRWLRFRTHLSQRAAFAARPRRHPRSVRLLGQTNLFFSSLYSPSSYSSSSLSPLALLLPDPQTICFCISLPGMARRTAMIAVTPQRGQQEQASL